jgi:hypothetical protein
LSEKDAQTRLGLPRTFCGTSNHKDAIPNSNSKYCADRYRRQNAGAISIFRPPVQILERRHGVGAVASSPDERRSRDIRDPAFRCAHAGYGCFIEEALFFPFAPYDGSSGACSRSYDMQPVAASKWERAEWEAAGAPGCVRGGAL